MAGIKISQLDNGGAINSIDVFPVARGNSTFKVPANQIVTGGENTGNGVSVFKTINPNGGVGGGTATLQFYSLTATEELLSINLVGDTIVVNASAQSPIKYKYFGNGTNTTYAVDPGLSKNVNNYRIDIDGVLQEPGDDYNVIGSNIVFTSPPPSSSKIVIVTNNLVKTVDAVPSPNTITCDMLNDSAFNCIGTFIGASPWRFVTTGFSLTASERVGTLASASLTGTLPTNPAAGTMVTIADASYNWNTYYTTISSNLAIDGSFSPLVCDVPGKVVMLLYTGTTWRTLW